MKRIANFSYISKVWVKGFAVPGPFSSYLNCTWRRKTGDLLNKMWDEAGTSQVRWICFHVQRLPVVWALLPPSVVCTQYDSRNRFWRIFCMLISESVGIWVTSSSVLTSLRRQHTGDPHTCYFRWQFRHYPGFPADRRKSTFDPTR